MRYSLRMLAVVAAAVAVACSEPAAQSQQDVESLKKAIEELRASQEAMAKDLAEVREFLRAATGGRFGAPPIVGRAFEFPGAPTNGKPSAPVTLVEISDYHCPFCRRHFQQTQPQIYSEYVNAGKVRHVFVHYPIEQLHPDAYKSHEAASCAADQGRFWDFHAKLFEKPVRSVEELTRHAAAAGLDTSAFRACLDSGKHAQAVRESVRRIQEMGVTGTPMFLVARTPENGGPITVAKTIEGAQPYDAFKQAFDQLLNQ